MAFHIGDDDDDIVAEINMTPLIDIMLVLLILFMVTSSVSLESGLDVELPKIAGQTESKEGSAVIISLGEEGGISVQGKQVSFDNLSSAITQSLEQEKTGLVILEGDSKSRLGNAVQIMDIAKAAGAKSFAIAAESQKGN